MNRLVCFMLAAFYISCCFAYGIGEYKVGQRLTTEQARQFLKKYNSRETQNWVTPTIKDIPKGKEGDEIREAIELLTHTSLYMGPKAKNKEFRYARNNLNCTNCHEVGPSGLPGTKKYSLPWVNLINDYPKLDTKTMKIISLEDRVIGMVGHGKVKFLPDSHYMKLIIHYYRWLSQHAKPGKKMEGTGLYKIKLSRAANPIAGRKIYEQQCQQCHMTNGKGMKQPNFDHGGGYINPPVAGNDTFDDAGHLTMIPVIASIIYVNMPYLQATYDHPKLSVEEAYDVAAFIALLPRAQNPDIFNTYPDPQFRPDSFVIPEYFPNKNEYLRAKLGPFKKPYPQ